MPNLPRPNRAKRVRAYEREDGTIPFNRWLRLIDPRAAAKVAAARAKLAAGHTGNLKSVGEGVSEYRIDFGPGYRMYLGQDGDTLIILLIGGDKASQPKDIAMAKDLWKEYKTRKPTRSVC